MTPIFFAGPDELRAWLGAHDGEHELWIGFYKKASGKGGITNAEAVDEALCHGWIDGVRRTIDADSYTNRFTPRRRGSVWSAVNIKRAHELIAAGRMQPAGLAAFEARDETKSGRDSYEQPNRDLAGDELAHLRADAAAWAFYEAQPPSYRRAVAGWVRSAVREETRRKRLAVLIDDCRAGRRIAAFVSARKR